MFFNKDKKISARLAAFAIYYCEEQLKQLGEIQSEKQLSVIEAQRLKFCLYILNITMVICWVVFHGRNSGNAKKIADLTLENFLKTFVQPVQTTSFYEYPRIGDLIIDSIEIALIGMAMPSGATVDTRTDYGGLLGLTYNIRAKQYSDLLIKQVRDAFSDKAPSLEHPLAALFMKHVLGEERLDNIGFLLQLDIELTKFFFVFGKLVKEAL